MGKDTEMRNEVRSIARKAWLASRGRSWAEPLRQTIKTLFSLTKQFHSTPRTRRGATRGAQQRNGAGWEHAYSRAGWRKAVETILGFRPPAQEIREASAGPVALSALKAAHFESARPGPSGQGHCARTGIAERRHRRAFAVCIARRSLFGPSRACPRLSRLRWVRRGLARVAAC
jgi:hypothetical protein